MTEWGHHILSTSLSLRTQSGLGIIAIMVQRVLACILANCNDWGAGGAQALVIGNPIKEGVSKKMDVGGFFLN